VGIDRAPVAYKAKMGAGIKATSCLRMRALKEEREAVADEAGDAVRLAIQSVSRSMCA